MSVAESNVSSAPGRSREATRQRLVEAGTHLFAEQGLHGATSAQIARAAGVATGTFYLHFKDKHELFREIALAGLADLRGRQDRAAHGATPGSPADLRLRLQELVAFTADNRDLIRVAFGRGAESAAIADAVMDEIVPGIAQRLTARRERGEIAAGIHPVLAAQALAAQTVRVLAFWVEHPDAASEGEVVATLLALHPFRVPESTT